MRLSSLSGGLTRTHRLHLCPATLTLALFQVALLLWGQMAQATFQRPPFLQTLSERPPSKGHGEGSDRLYAVPAAVPNIPVLGRYSPKKKNLKPHKLMRRLRKDWDPFWMSAERPPDVEDTLVKNAASDPTLQQAVSQLNLSLPGPDGVPRAMEEPLRQALGTWLLQRATCRVHYVWDDLGVLYWPRWVRRGFCRAADALVPPSSSSAAYRSASPPATSASTSSSAHSEVPSLADSCSWPPGMHCVPAQSRPIRILRWQCQQAEEYNRWKRRYRHALQPPPLDDDKSIKRPQEDGKNPKGPQAASAKAAIHPSDSPKSSRVLSSGGDSKGKPPPSGGSPSNSHTRAAARPSGLPNEVDRRLKRETRFKVGGGAVMKNHTERDVVTRERKEEDVEEETNETENWIRKTMPKRPKLSLHCKWKKIRYPVTDDCFCSC